MVAALLDRLGVNPALYQQGWQGPAEVEQQVGRAERAFEAWRKVPAPRRGELVRQFGELLRQYKADLGELVSWEAGKITQEGLGEVQEMIDICDFAVGLSRQLYGLTIASERPGHHMRESWHPLGVVGVISAFNFPVAVWAWNTALALVCGNPVIWKPSEKTPLTALACQALFDRVLKNFSDAVALVSATGSTRMGREVAPKVAARFARSILELGGNNAMILGPSADLDMAVRAILFSAVGTAGQRCTTLRRLIAHESVKDEIVTRLKAAYAKVRIGHPLEGNLVGPLIDKHSFDAMQDALEQALSEGGRVFGGKRQLEEVFPHAYYVSPAIVEMPEQSDVVRHETFAPILYVIGYSDFNEALRLNNSVPQGLSSCIFTTDVREAEQFMSAAGSDCGIANVNAVASRAPMPGAATCGARPTPSTTRWNCRWPRASSSTEFL